MLSPKSTFLTLWTFLFTVYMYTVTISIQPLLALLFPTLSMHYLHTYSPVYGEKWNVHQTVGPHLTAFVVLFSCSFFFFVIFFPRFESRQECQSPSRSSIRESGAWVEKPPARNITWRDCMAESNAYIYGWGCWRGIASWWNSKPHFPPSVTIDVVVWSSWLAANTPRFLSLSHPIATRRFRAGWRSAWAYLTRKKRWSLGFSSEPPCSDFDNLCLFSQKQTTQTHSKKQNKIRQAFNAENSIKCRHVSRTAACIEIRPTRNQRQRIAPPTRTHKTEMFCASLFYVLYSLTRTVDMCIHILIIQPVWRNVCFLFGLAHLIDIHVSKYLTNEAV